MRTRNRIQLLLQLTAAFLLVPGVLAGAVHDQPDSTTYRPPARAPEDRVISLAGDWGGELDPKNVGTRERWFVRDLSDSLHLPGTLDERGKGPLNEERLTRRLTRVRNYNGAAWYQRSFDLPREWDGRRVQFVIERCKASRVWIDDRAVGNRDTLTVEQVFDLGSDLRPGRHRLTVCVDNTNRPPVGDPHQLSEETQTNWNGLLGHIELRARDAVWIESVRTFPDVKNKRVRVVAELGRGTSVKQASGSIILRVQAWNVPGAGHIPPATASLPFKAGDRLVTVDLNLGNKALTWDEFSPALYRLRVELETDSATPPAHDMRETDFGLREFVAEGTRFAINGRTTFLRGKHDACVFPLTGYAPMSVAEWIRILGIAKSYGINHYRFHSWCPPEAALAAADVVGIYMQPELPNWSSLMDLPRPVHEKAAPGDSETSDARRTRYLLAEGLRILKAYGNHPSFVMFALGNELAGNRSAMAALIEAYRHADPRPLYAQGSNNFLWSPTPSPGDDFWTTTMTGGHYTSGVYFPDTRNRLVRGSFPVHSVGHINNHPPGTEFDFREALKGVTLPVIGHETGQFQVFPDFKEIDKYTGVLQARNFGIFRERLEEAGMLDQADRFVQASGALSVICYREDIEAALRTPGFAGFQLLDLQDFPGQGTALVGILNAFMESKGLITPEDWRAFCGPVVPLLRMPRYTWLQHERFQATSELANFGPGPLPDTALHWQVTGLDQRVHASGTLAPVDAPQGRLTSLGDIRFDLSALPAPATYQLQLKTGNGAAKNQYRFWVYPDEVPTDSSGGVTVSRALDGKARRALAAGKPVLILPDEGALTRGIPGAFQSDFWCYPMFRKYNPPGTLGILCDPAHPALAAFPTSFHSDWQWWPILRHGRAMILDKTPKDFMPVVQVVDNFERNHKLAIAFEARVDKGRLFVCSGALVERPHSPASRQLLHSLLRYIGSDKFQPEHALDFATLETILTKQ